MKEPGQGEPPRELRSAGTAARLRMGLQVGAAATLAAAAALLLTWLAERPGLRLRWDLTAAGDNTLEPASMAVLEKVHGEAEIDVFFKPMAGFLGPVAYDVQERTLRLLLLLRDASGGRVRFRQHDLVSLTGKAAAQARMQELSLREVEPGGLVVVSLGPRRSVLHLRGDLADIDPGDPRGEGGPPRPARLVLFRAEEALVSALLKVGQGDTLRALFSAGHGERDLESTDLGGLSELRRGLESDGFAVDRWEGKRGGKVPDDCSVLAIIGPEQPFTTAEADAVREFVEGGGRLVAAPGRGSGQGSAESESGLPALLSRWGIRVVTEGIVSAPRATTIPGQRLYETPQCAEVSVWSEGMAAMSPVTEALRRADRYVDLPFSRSLERGAAPRGGSVITLLTTDDSTWRDLENTTTRTGHDWKRTPEEARGPFALGMAALFPPLRAQAVRHPGPELSQPECRVVCLGSTDAFANQSWEVNSDLLLNAFDWAVAREFRVHVAPHSRAARRLDVASGNALAGVHLVTVVLLPGLCLVLGFLTAWRRRRR
jgi:ABC-2 type transport system permease protein